MHMKKHGYGLKSETGKFYLNIYAYFEFRQSLLDEFEIMI